MAVKEAVEGTWNMFKGLAGGTAGAVGRNKGKSIVAGGLGGLGTYNYLAPEDQFNVANSVPPPDFSTQGPADQESSKQMTSTSTSTQKTSREGALVPVVAPPALEAPKKPTMTLLEQLDINKPGDEAVRLKELFDAQRTPEEKNIFINQKNEIKNQLAELKKQYGKARDKAKGKGEQDAVTARWAQAAEGLMNAAITIYAAQQGLAKGQNIAGNLQLTRNDWNAEINASLKRAAEERAALFQEERAYAGDLEKTGAELTRGEERAQDKEFQAVRDVKQLQAQRDRDVQQENFRRAGINVTTQNTAAEKAAQNDFEASKFNRQQALQTSLANASAANADRPSVITQTVERTGTEEGDRTGGGSPAAKTIAAKQTAYTNLTGAIGRLRTDNSDKIAVQDVSKNASLLGIDQAGITKIMNETTGAGAKNLAESDVYVENLVNSLIPKPNNAGPAAASSDNVTLVNPDGTAFLVPKAQVNYALEKYPGSKIKGQ